VSEVAELVRAAADGDQGAWNGLVDRYNRLVWSVARAHRLSGTDAADVVQTTWLRAVEHLGRLHDPENLGAWLATTARHESLRAIRLGSRHVPTSMELAFDTPDAAPIDANLLERERDRVLWASLGRLAERCQTLLRMLIADPPGSYDEISAALDMPIGSIGPTRGRCLERLRELAENGISRERNGL
jgi:RNA polymerase sigma factor (sigma-70 family)